MYGGKHIAVGDTIFLFASENEGGHGLIARGIVTSAESIARKRGVERQTPRVSVTVRRTALGQSADGAQRIETLQTTGRTAAPATELNFKFLSPGDEQDRRHFPTRRQPSSTASF